MIKIGLEKRVAMKFLHISDLHIGKRVNGFSMIEDQKYILKQILEIAEKKTSRWGFDSRRYLR